MLSKISIRNLIQLIQSGRLLIPMKNLKELPSIYTSLGIGLHGVSFHDPLDKIQNSAGRDGIVGFVATIIVGKKNRRMVALPKELPERDLIQFLLVFWLRNHWLKVIDSEEFLVDYWVNYGQSKKGEY